MKITGFKIYWGTGTGHSIDWSDNKIVLRNTISPNLAPAVTGKAVSDFCARRERHLSEMEKRALAAKLEHCDILSFKLCRFRCYL